MSNQTRPYTTEYQRINARIFRALLNKPVGFYSLDSDHLGDEHREFELSENKNGDRSIIFTIQNKPHTVNLKVDNRSASTKLYLCCPYCHKQRQSLYAIKTAYACRECIGLHYASQSERPQDRLIRRIRKQRQKLWGSEHHDINNVLKHAHHFEKPKYMKQETFDKKRNTITHLESKYWRVEAINMEKIYGDLLAKIP